MSGAVVRWCDGKPRPGDQALLDWLLAEQAAAEYGRAGEQTREARRRVPPRRAGDRLPANRERHGRTRDGEDRLPAERARQRGRTRRDGAARLPADVRRAERRGEKPRQRPAGTRGVAAPPGSPADRPRVRQPRLALGVRRRAGRHAGRLRPAGRTADRTPNCWTTWPREFIREGWSTKKLVRRLVLSADLPAVGARSRRRAGPRPREPAAAPLPDAPARSRGDPRQPARGVGPARPATVRAAHLPAARRPRTAPSDCSPARSTGTGGARSTCRCRSWTRRSSSSASTCRTCGCRPAGAT